MDYYNLPFQKAYVIFLFKYLESPARGQDNVLE